MVSPPSDDAPPAAPPAVRGRRRRLVLAGVAGVLAIGFTLATVRLFVLPHRDAPARADAIVMFAGSTGRIERAVALARAGYAPVLVVSTPTADDPCPRGLTEVEVICFAPVPLTTRGESRWLAAAAAQRGWRSVLVITATTQTTRARLRLDRCYHGEARMISVPPPRGMWPYMIAYEWAAMGKALVLQRGC
ncbi:YdcF family protein [Candidatus Frankia nodulisporulans]|uniref:YdcF family protein n=1 Tax=Candidatus Frankia nodulisporulans TaxID=2060052 RepID=UPI0013CF6D5E|nr:YdcF family protein [Candidatus Frankia nodulisporulans]